MAAVKTAAVARMNGSLGLLQQWWVGRKHSKPPVAPEAKGKALEKKTVEK